MFAFTLAHVLAKKSRGQYKYSHIITDAAFQIRSNRRLVPLGKILSQFLFTYQPVSMIPQNSPLAQDDIDAIEELNFFLFDASVDNLNELYRLLTRGVPEDRIPGTRYTKRAKRVIIDSFTKFCPTKTRSGKTMCV